MADTTLKKVEVYLQSFKIKMDTFGVVFRDDRGKNSVALLELELRPAQREDVLKALQTIDYSEGPLDDELYKGNALWVFGKVVKNREVYIKIQIGKAGEPVCISFHPAEYPMNYPFK